MSQNVHGAAHALCHLLLADGPAVQGSAAVWLHAAHTTRRSATAADHLAGAITPSSASTTKEVAARLLELSQSLRRPQPLLSSEFDFVHLQGLCGA